jgi:uncharacterized protein YjbJ (UPF0337 family)
MNDLQIKGDWNQTKGSIKQAWGDLTDDDVTAIEGRRDRLVGAIQKRYGVAQEEAERQVDHWMGKA